MTSARRRTAAIAATAWIEARRTRLPWIVLIMAGLVLLASLLGESLTIAEGERVRIAFLAGGIRVGAVFVVCLHTATSLLREQQDKGTDLLLSLDIPRAGYLAGKALGYMSVAAAVCAMFWLPLLLFAPPGPSLAWLASLVLEAWIVTAATIFCALTFSQLMVSASFVFALYLLARTMAAIVLIATATPFLDPTWGHAVFARLVQTLAFLLPPLDRFTRTDWLVGHGPTATELVLIAFQAAVFSALLLAAAAIDLYRKNL